jgi:hypothetical protein
MDDIARDVVQRSQRHNQYVVNQYVVNKGGFHWPELERGVRAQIRRHLRDITRARVIVQGPDFEDWPAPYPIRNPRNIRHLSTRFTLSVERIRTGVLDAAPMLTVTFHQYLEPETFRIDETAERRRRERGNVNRFQALSASELESLCAQMDRTTCWRNVHTIRLIRWRVGGTVEYTLEFVSTDEHGNEVTSPLDAVVQNPRRIELLESGFLERLGLRRYDVHLATARHRWETICDSMSTRPSLTDAVEWRLPHA